MVTLSKHHHVFDSMISFLFFFYGFSYNIRWEECKYLFAMTQEKKHMKFLTCFNERLLILFSSSLCKGVQSKPLFFGISIPHLHAHFFFVCFISTWTRILFRIIIKTKKTRREKIQKHSTTYTNEIVFELSDMSWWKSFDKFQPISILISRL